MFQKQSENIKKKKEWGKMRDDIQIRATKSFKTNLERLYPNKRGSRERIKELNTLLEELIYGKK